MRKLFAITLLFLSFNSFSQKTPYPSSNNGIGIKVGLNMTTIYPDLGIIKSSSLFKVGATFGAYWQARISRKTAFIPEVNFSMQGYKIDNKDSWGVTVSNHYKTKYYLNYISIPILLKTYMGNCFNIHYGPQIGILAKAYSSTHYYLDDSDVKESVEGCKRGELLMVAGVGYDFPFRANLSLRMIKGLTNISKHKPNGNGFTNLFFQFAVGYIFSNKNED